MARRQPLLDDWGERSPRWAGIGSVEIDVCGASIHALQIDGPVDGMPQLLVHGLGGSAANWLEVMRDLASRGPVLAPDLPGFGRTRPPRPGASRIGGNARFLRALLDTVGWDRVVVHGNSMGGTVSVLFAAAAPHRVDRLVLSSPALPASLLSLPRLAPRTMVRFAPFLVPGLGRALLAGLWAVRRPEQLWDQFAAYLHGDPTRLAPAVRAVGIDNVAYGHEHRWRRPGFVAAAESVVAGVLAAGPLRRAVDAVTAPTLVVWGNADLLVGRPVVDHVTALRPDWALHVLDGVGHVPQLEVPDAYLAVVTAWLDALPRDGGPVEASA